MALSAIVLSEDPAVVDILKPLLPELGIASDQCSFPDAALRLLASDKYEAIIIDDEILGGFEFMASLRELPMSRNAIIFALVSYVSIADAFQNGANFVLEKPLTPERAQRSFRAAQGLIVRERRRYYRHPVNFSATLEYGKQTDVVLVTNLSEGGMAFETGTPIMPGTIVKFKFDLPESRRSIEGKGEVSWTDGTGRVGLCFGFVPFAYKLRLEEWLDARSRQDSLGSMVVQVGEGWNVQ